MPTTFSAATADDPVGRTHAQDPARSEECSSTSHEGAFCMRLVRELLVAQEPQAA